MHGPAVLNQNMLYRVLSFSWQDELFSSRKEGNGEVRVRVRVRLGLGLGLGAILDKDKCNHETKTKCNHKLSS